MPSVTKVKSCGRRKMYWMEAQGELIFREQLPKSMTYDHNRAYDLLPKSKTAKHTLRCKVRCVSDGIKVKKASTFGTSPPRKFYAYKDIQRFYSFSDFPTFLILGSSDPDTQSRYYDIFKFEEPQVQELCELIDRAREHPLYLLVDDEASKARYHSSQSSLASDAERKSETVEHQQAVNTDVQNVDSVEETRVHEEVIQLNEAPLETCHEEASEEELSLRSIEEPELEATERIQPTINSNVAMAAPESMGDKVLSHHRPTIPEHLLSDPNFKKLCQNIQEDDLWAVDMKYVEAHPQYGNQIVPSGAVYLFVAHHKYPDMLTLTKDIPMENHFCLTENAGMNTAETEFTTKFVRSPTVTTATH